MGVFQPTITDSDLTTTYATEVHALGTLYQEKNGKMYRFVKVTDAVDVTIGMSLGISTEGNWAVTPDRSGGTGLSKALETTSVFVPVAGIALGSVDVSEEPYCWIQVGGLCVNILTDENVTASNLIGAHATTDGVAILSYYETNLDPTENTFAAFAVAYADDTSTVGVGYLHNCWFKA